MKLRINQAELFPVFQCLIAPGAWGGGEQRLLACQELAEKFDLLKKFKPGSTYALEDAAKLEEEYELSDPAVRLLRQIWGGGDAPMDWNVGMVCAGALRRLFGAAGP